LYTALVWGDFAEDSKPFWHVGRHKRFRKIMDAYPDGEYGKDATTHYTVLERFGYTTLLECKQTGRTHQIRVHAAHQSSCLTTIPMGATNCEGYRF
jgi:23S rRNA pseudouridine1911/1915/1917 synthase